MTFLAPEKINHLEINHLEIYVKSYLYLYSKTRNLSLHFCIIKIYFHSLIKLLKHEPYILNNFGEMLFDKFQTLQRIFWLFNSIEKDHRETRPGGTSEAPPL